MQNMNGFKRLTVENFQNHINTTVEFAQAGQLTVLIGRSRSGKTAIIRALRWLLYNSPSGVAIPTTSSRAQDSDEKSGYCRVGASFIKVTLEMTDGHKVIRERTASTNRYWIVYPVSDGQGGQSGQGGQIREPLRLEGFGTNVPLEVQEITGVRPIKIGDTEININLSEQLDGPFLGSKSMSSPARAKVLGKLAGTEEIDFAGKELGTDLYRRNQDVRRLDGEIKDLDVKIEQYGWLDAEAVRIRTLEELVADVKALQERRGQVAGLGGRLGEVEGFVSGCEAVLARWACLDAVAVEVAGAISAALRKEALYYRRHAFVTLSEGITRCNEILVNWQGIEKAESIAFGVESDMTQRQRFVEKYMSLLKTESIVVETQKWLANLQGINQADSIVQSVQSLAERRQILARLQSRYKDTGQGVEGAQGIVARLAGVDEAEKLSGEVLTLMIAMDKVKQSRTALTNTAAFVDKAREQAVLWENRVSELQGAYQDELVTLGVCPVCNSIIDSERVREAC